MKPGTRFMKIAIQEALKSTEPLKCGVVIASEQSIIAKAFNSQRSDHDATAHAEIKAIRVAGSKLKQKDLRHCTIYCTCEPCLMCLAAIINSKISEIVFGVSLNTVSPKSKLPSITTKEFLSSYPRRVLLKSNFLRAQCLKSLYS
jgi:tRNA(adenine34) deaminase